MKIPFTKMHGAGNDYVYLDCINHDVPSDLSALAQAISNRHFGVGSDGLILIHPSESADARMQMFNADGSEAEMCGNGLRCVAKYLHDHGITTSQRQHIETGSGTLETQLIIREGVATQVRIDMGPPGLDAKVIPTLIGEGQVIEVPITVGSETINVTCLSMGNPHCVVFVEQITDSHVLELGPLIENHAVFPERANVAFVQVVARDEVIQRTWERGSGETLACGTGASAACVAGFMTGRTVRRITNHLRGGDLELEWDESNNRVYLTGPAESVFEGTYQWK